MAIPEVSVPPAHRSTCSRFSGVGFHCNIAFRPFESQPCLSSLSTNSHRRRFEIWTYFIVF
jgi:hypothetical protein